MAWVKRRRVVDDKLRASRAALKARLDKTAAPCALDPQAVAYAEYIKLIGAIARVIDRRGFAPVLGQLCRDRKWNRDAAAWYAAEAERNGHMIKNSENGWVVTEGGCALLGVEPVYPRLATSERTRVRDRLVRKLIREQGGSSDEASEDTAEAP